MPNPFFWTFLAGAVVGAMCAIIYEGRTYAKTVAQLQKMLTQLDADWREAYESLERQYKKATKI